jgi:hypothetical protein
MVESLDKNLKSFNMLLRQIKIKNINDNAQTINIDWCYKKSNEFGFL